MKSDQMGNAQTQTRPLAVAVASLCFFVGLFLNHTTFATNDYRLIVSIAAISFVAVLLIVAVSW